MTVPRRREVPPPARQAAFDALRSVDERDAFVNLLLPPLLRERRLDARDAALATELVHGTLRWQGTYDAIIDHLASGRTIEPAVRDALRLGCHQLLSMRVPDHAAVSTTVDLVKSVVGHRATGFVNAILRRVAARPLDAWMAEVTTGLATDAALAVRTSHPEWIVVALREALGAAGDLEGLLAADNLPPKVTLVARPGLCEPSELPGEPGRLSPYARILAGGDPSDIPAIREGRAGVQDEGSQVVALRLAEAQLEGPDQTWLDLCAGPGGKAALLGALAAQRGATLVANEVQPHRAELVAASVTNLPNVTVTTEDGRSGPWSPGTFDRILVDAPCTGLGALRRRPESRWRRKPADLADLVPLQQALLTRALELVRPGGVVAYATCSPHLAETRDVVASVGVEPELVMQLWPHIDGTDAMYCAIIRRGESALARPLDGAAHADGRPAGHGDKQREHDAGDRHRSLNGLQDDQSGGKDDNHPADDLDDAPADRSAARWSGIRFGHVDRLVDFQARVNARVLRGRCNSEPAVTVRDPRRAS